MHGLTCRVFHFSLMCNRSNFLNRRQEATSAYGPIAKKKRVGG
jgi:hypothetical protein